MTTHNDKIQRRHNTKKINFSNLNNPSHYYPEEYSVNNYYPTKWETLREMISTEQLNLSRKLKNQNKQSGLRYIPNKTIILQTNTMAKVFKKAPQNIHDMNNTFDFTRGTTRIH